MSPILKVISALQFGPWKFWKFCFGPYALPPAPCSVFPGAAVQSAARAACRPGATSSFAAASRGIHASHWTSSHRPLPRVVPLQPVPRAPVSSAGCHRNTAVEGSLQCLGLTSCARLSTPGDPASQSTRPLARSLPRTRRTSPPPRVTSDELTPTAEPPFQSSSTPTTPTNSFASS